MSNKRTFLGMDKTVIPHLAVLAFCIIVVIVAIVIGAYQTFFKIKGNYKMVDVVYDYDSAIIAMPDGHTISGKVDSWYDYENSDQIQVVIDGVTYLVHSNNVVLIKGK